MVVSMEIVQADANAMKIVSANDEASSYLEWRPGTNTVAYYPLDSVSAFYDKSGNNRNLTNNGLTIGTYQGIESAYNNGTANKYAWLNSPLFTGNNKFTISVWFYTLGNSSGWQSIIQVGYGTGTQAFNMALNKNVIYFGGWSNDTSTGVTKTGQWVNYVVTNDGTTLKAYVNGELVKTANLTYTIPSSGKTSILSNYIRTDGGTSDPWNGYISRIIVEDKAWELKDIVKDFNDVKGRYGL